MQLESRDFFCFGVTWWGVEPGILLGGSYNTKKKFYLKRGKRNSTSIFFFQN